MLESCIHCQSASTNFLQAFTIANIFKDVPRLIAFGAKCISWGKLRELGRRDISLRCFLLTDFVVKYENNIIVKKIDIRTGSWSILVNYKSWAIDVLKIASEMNINEVIRVANSLSRLLQEENVSFQA
ncbi:hypothetical protein THAOC_11712 [Thalassiosira oceanica]|uniref:Uncharacterized protein n=1 Tax=Thalassiosira oceanica TaxID=159749 RepID=K0SQM0_THAOC|nr:hypothetical protein THAOC_11712 [Thalassiosira oceanica]|eukprot:EJK67279.1 hypothetical protein THAOC_11712 [Thalassiosira oceanica]